MSRTIRHDPGRNRHEDALVYDPDILSSLIGNIYDAALDPTLWRSALESTASFVRGCAAALVWHDAIDRRGQF